MRLKSRDLTAADPPPLAWSARRAASSAATGLAIALAAWALWTALQWTVVNATWVAPSSAQCDPAGACWAVIAARWRLIFFGLFPVEDQWRAAIASAAVVAAVGMLQWRWTWTLPRVGGLLAGTSALFLVLMYGGLFDLRYVPTDRWGGFALTLFLYLFGVVIGFPTGVALALLRRGRNIRVARITAFVVDTVRTLPMVMVLFTVGVLAPMLLPGEVSGDKLWRVAIAFAFVYGCYQSEIVRAGLQAIPRTQDEAAQALALGPFLRLRLVLLPQGLANGLPATVNLLVATFKETSIVAIIGFFDFTASAQAAFGTADWTNAFVEVYLFIGAVYFGCASAMAWLGHRVERRLATRRA